MEITEEQCVRIEDMLAGAARQCEPIQSAVSQCRAVCGRARVQVAWAPKTVWQLAHWPAPIFRIQIILSSPQP